MLVAILLYKIHFSATSQVPVVFHSPNTVLKLKVSSEAQGNLLIVNPHKSKRQMIYFQHTLVQDIHYHSKREEREHREELLDQSKPKTQQDKLQIPSKGFDGSDC